MTAPTLAPGATLAALRPEWAAGQLERVERRLAVMRAAVGNATPGHALAEGEGYRWIVYRLDDGRNVAAVYLAGRLLRRDHAEWFVVDYWGKRQTVKGDPAERLAGTAPVGWPRHPEHLDIGGDRG